jgi:dienelactone hydrolase
MVVSLVHKVIGAGAALAAATVLHAAPVTEAFTYPSSVTSDANGPLDLVAELNYEGSRSNAPIAVVMHGYSGTSGMCASVRENAQHLRDKGFFAIAVALRGRDGCDGTRDSGGLEIYDIYDAVEAVKTSRRGLVNPAIVYLTGYSGGGGNTMAALTKFPDYFNAGAAYFGMSDYGYHLTNAWYFAGASSSHQAIMRTDVGTPTGGVAGVRDRYHARASNLASANNPYSEIHLFVNANEATCPPVNMTSFLSNAVSREAYAGEFSNITVHIGQPGPRKGTGLEHEFIQEVVQRHGHHHHERNGGAEAEGRFYALRNGDVGTHAEEEREDHVVDEDRPDKDIQ